MKTKLQVNYRLRVHDAVTRRVKREIRGHNVVLDAGLTALANMTGTADIFTNLCVGSDATANYITGGVITFTQALTTITASAPFFTGAMVGGIFKFGHGTGGLEAYIQSIGGGGTTAVVDVSRAVPVGDAGTVWLTQQTKLVAFSYNYDAYVTSSGACSTTPVYAGGVATVTHQRTFIINTKVTSYTINELGWGSTGGANPNIKGRVVLGAPEVIGVSDYVVITLQLIFTLAPPIPVLSAAGDQVWNQYKGTGTFTGSFALEKWATQTVLSTGASDSTNAVLDGVNPGYLRVITDAAFTQNAHVGATGVVPATSYVDNTAQLSWAQVAGSGTGVVGVSRCTHNYSFNTAGETLYGVGVTKQSFGGQQVVYDMVPNWSGGVPATLPIGAFVLQTVWQNIWTRPLLNP